MDHENIDTTGTSNDVIVDYDRPSIYYPEDSIVPAALLVKSAPRLFRIKAS